VEIRELTMERERRELASYATLSSQSRGREREEPPCPIRTCFARDRDRILHSNAFRRLKRKTQVFIAPEGDHYRERMTHTLEVTQIARTIARALRLNEDLTEAIALGHDLGHTPFGHTGEKVLNELCDAGFEHSEQSVRVVEVLENEGRGLNLTFEVRDGIRNHRTKATPRTPEGHVVRLCDKIAYINHDIQDAQRCGELDARDLPADCVALLGETSAQRIHTMVSDTIEHSHDGVIAMSAPVERAMQGLRAYLFENLYLSERAMTQGAKAEALLRVLFGHYLGRADSMPEAFEARAANEGRQRAVCDYIAGMSDQYAIRSFEELFIPQHRA
jgi:dGTPase